MGSGARGQVSSVRIQQPEPSTGTRPLPPDPWPLTPDTRMALKESSDELNEPVLVTGVRIAPTRRARTAKDRLALAIATCGVGYIPIAPGTCGSAVGVTLYLLLRWLTLSLVGPIGPANSVVLLDPGIVFLAIELIVIVFVTLIGIWAASQAETIFQRKDPGQVVIDEVAGQLIALLPIPLSAVGPWRLLVLLGFLLFRAFDVIKPYPVRRLETLKSGLGIVADDLAAGTYAAALVAIIAACFSFF
jgi:phosphatidylglycerophosphatase A